MNTPSNILVLCHGNVNRSPLAHYIIQETLGREVRSAGVKPDASGPASRKLKRWAEARYDMAQGTPIADLYTKVRPHLEQHRARPVTMDLLAWADRVILMDKGNLRHLEAFVSSTVGVVELDPRKDEGVYTLKGEPIIMLGEWHQPPLPRIPDPAFLKGGSSEAHNAFLACEQAAIRLAENGL
jgi:protein-tyrosine-phosphatase